MKEATQTPLCKQCGREFNSKTVWQKFCSSKCNSQWWSDSRDRKQTERICVICGASFISPKGNWKTCSEGCKQKRLEYVRSIEYKNQHTDFNNKKLNDAKYYQNNKDKIIQYSKEYYESKKNEYEFKRKRCDYILKRIKTDKDFHLAQILRSRILCALRDGWGRKKNTRTTKMIGCTIQQLKQHLQNTAIENGYKDFDIEKYDTKEYHIDHIMPCASFDLTKEEEQMKCFNYTNLQILDAKTNLSKGCKIYG